MTANIKEVHVTVTLTEDQAWALAQLAKRFGFFEAQSLSADKPERDLMLDAIIALQGALYGEGYSPR
jgi:hypothetical protein